MESYANANQAVAKVNQAGSTTFRQLALMRSQESPNLIYRNSDEPAVVLRYLQRSVAARPNMLRYHIRRIYLALQCKDTEQVYGALADLMLVLRGKGRTLQERMIDQAASVIAPEHLTSLRLALDTRDLGRLKAMPMTESVFSNTGFALCGGSR